jgi:hypothetical protein
VYVVTDVEETVQLGCNLEFSTVPVPEVCLASPLPSPTER